MTRKRSPAFGLLAVLAATLPGVAQEQAAATQGPVGQEAARSQDCFEELTRESGAPDIACDFPTRLSEQERADLQKLTRGILHNLQCTVSIRIERARVAEAIVAHELVFQSPPQPVVCEITTRSSAFAIKATFAPRVVFKDGEAIDGSPGLGNVEGVSRFLAWPVVQYVNRASGIRSDMLKIINAYRAHVRSGRAAAGP